jgi:hypothetical protein
MYSIYLPSVCWRLNSGKKTISLKKKKALGNVLNEVEEKDIVYGGVKREKGKERPVLEPD